FFKMIRNISDTQTVSSMSHLMLTANEVLLTQVKSNRIERKGRYDKSVLGDRELFCYSFHILFQSELGRKNVIGEISFLRPLWKLTTIPKGAGIVILADTVFTPMSNIL